MFPFDDVMMECIVPTSFTINNCRNISLDIFNLFVWYYVGEKYIQNHWSQEEIEYIYIYLYIVISTMRDDGPFPKLQRHSRWRFMIEM